MKSFSQLLEALNSYQRQKVDSWRTPGESAADKISAHVFPKGQDRITIPLEDGKEAVEPHPIVKNHLEKNGYKVKDYRKGLAVDKYGRDVSIGKVLNKSKAPEGIAKVFTNDPARASSKHSNLQVVITKHPHDVAGMSTDRGWDSCMTMGDGYSNRDKGSNARYLQHDIRQGTHVAYLTHAGDHKAENPIARIALKPFHSTWHGNSGHTVLRPEHTTYGEGGPAFEQTVKNFTEKHYPMQEKTYWKDSNLYHDSGPRQLVNIGHPDILKGATNDVKKEVIKHGRPEHLTALMHDPDIGIRKQVAFKGNKETLDHLVNDSYDGIRQIVGTFGHKEHLDKLVNDKEHGPRFQVAVHGHKEHLDKLVNDPHYVVRREVAEKGHKEHLDKLVNDPDESVRQAVAAKGSKEHHDKLVNDPDEFTRMEVARHGSKEHLDKLVHDPSETVRANVANRGSTEHNNILVNDPDPRVRRQVAEYSNSKEHLAKLMSFDNDKLVRIKAEKRYTEIA